jgi:drug/metabolite transporter (DMT)-like permease
MKTLFLTALALSAFAANSVLCRLALGEGAIDAMGFTTIRLFAGVLTLLIILKLNSEPVYPPTKGSWTASLMLFLYAITFSFAYVTLDTGTGALILFGSVQTTMILLSVIRGTRLHLSEWLGLLTAFGGFIYLILPGLSTPSIMGFALMSISGAAWGVYTLKGRGSKNPLLDTAHNFLRTVPLILILFLVGIKTAHYSLEGILFAVLSGSLASGIGYTIWYMALRGLSATQAAVIQLSVPVIAAFGGVLFVSEVITFRLGVSTMIILGGILMVILGKLYFVQVAGIKKA